MGLVKLPAGSKEFFEEHYPSILDSGQLAEGPWNDELAASICRFNHSRYCIPVVSNGAGVLAVLQVLQSLYDSRNVLLQGNTMYGVKTMVNSAGYQVIAYVDCCLETLMPTFEQVNDALGRLGDSAKNCVLILSHIGGIPNPDIERIAELCRECGTFLVEDCAHSFLARTRKEFSGNFGIAGVFSFYATKAVPAGEGGAIVTQDEALFDRLDRFRKYDRFKRQMEIGLNIRPSELQALFILAVVQEGPSIIANKRGIAEQYEAVCKRKGLDYICPDGLDVESNYYKFILIDSSPDSSIFALDNRTSAVYDYFIDPVLETFPGMRQLVRGHVCLPTWAFLEQEHIDRVTQEISAL